MITTQGLITTLKEGFGPAHARTTITRELIEDAHRHHYRGREPVQIDVFASDIAEAAGWRYLGRTEGGHFAFERKLSTEESLLSDTELDWTKEAIAQIEGAIQLIDVNFNPFRSALAKLLIADLQKAKLRIVELK